MDVKQFRPHFWCLAVSSFSSRTQMKLRNSFSSHWLPHEKEARQAEEDDKMLFSFVLSKFHPFKFLLVKVIKDSIFLPTGMSIDIRNDVSLMIVSFAFIEISRAILAGPPQQRLDNDSGDLNGISLFCAWCVVSYGFRSRRRQEMETFFAVLSYRCQSWQPQSD